jgi:hypothetical protein
MEPKRAVAAFFLAQMLAAAAFAQTAATSSEFGRVSGGDIDLITKHSQPLSGSLGITAGSGKGYDATLGGTLVKDRVWFFGSAQRSEPMFASQFRAPLPAGAMSRSTDAKMIGQLGDRQSLAASFAASRQPFVTGGTLTAPIPSSFLSLHYTGIVSSNMFVSASFSEMRRSNPVN